MLNSLIMLVAITLTYSTPLVFGALGGVISERTAFFKAVSEGVRDFVAIAVVGGPEGRPVSEWCAPCGVCRQVMREFCDPDTFQVVLGRTGSEWRTYLLRDILPMGFGPEDLGRPAPKAAYGHSH